MILFMNVLNYHCLRTSLSLLQEIIASPLYTEAENALFGDNNNDASLLFAQADRLYVVAENLEAIVTEQME